MIKIGDYILVTDIKHKRYLQIGEVVNTGYCPYDYYIQSYKVQFIDGIDEYDWHFKDCYKIIMFERN